jgi:hypothetical protein
MLNRKTIVFALALGALGGIAGGASAQSVLYPRVIENGENKDIDYGPGGNQSAPFGGGRVVITGSGTDTTLRHLDPEYAQANRGGLVPFTVGSGVDSTTVWLPAGTDRSVAALIGNDGSLPQYAQDALDARSRVASAR